MRSGPSIWTLSMNLVGAATMLLALSSISMKAMLFLNSLVQFVWKKTKPCFLCPLRYSCKHLQSLLSRLLKSTYYLIILIPYFCPILSNSFSSLCITAAYLFVKGLHRLFLIRWWLFSTELNTNFLFACLQIQWPYKPMWSGPDYYCVSLEFIVTLIFNEQNNNFNCLKLATVTR